MKYNKIAVVGDKDAVLGFKAVGVEVFDATTAEQTAKILKDLAKQDYAVVFVAEDLAEQIPEREICLVKRKDQSLGAAARELERLILQNASIKA